VFSAYETIAAGRYRERFGLAFEEFEVGQRFRHRPGLTLSQQDNKDEALDTLNQAMLHYDAAYAAATEWERPLLVSTLTLQVAIGMTSKTFGRKRRIVSFEDIALTGPVFGGDTLYAESEILAKADEPDDDEVGRLSIVTRGANQRGEVVCTMTYTALVERGGLAPAAQQDSGDERLASHQAIAPSVYLEQIGLAFEDLRPGETWEHRPGKTFFAEESVRQALRALEQSPRLTEAGANRERHGGRLVINEVYVVGAVTALTTKTLGKVVANLGWKDVQLPHPVRDGDTVYAESTILDTRASQSRPTQGIAHVATRAFNQAGRLVCAYERRLLVYRQGQGGY
jgi:itaconyl-CoA hydratase